MHLGCERLDPSSSRSSEIRATNSLFLSLHQGCPETPDHLIGRGVGQKCGSPLSADPRRYHAGNFFPPHKLGQMTKEPPEPSALGGRPAHVPTDESRRMVEVLAGYGVTQLEIAHVVGVSAPTLRRAYREELDRGLAVHAKLIGNLLRLADGRDGTALRAIMFSLRCRFGWREASPELEGKKAIRNRRAHTAHEGTEWAEVLQ